MTRKRTPLTSAATDRSVLMRVGRRVLPLIFLGSLVSYVDRVNIGYAQLGMGKELGITAAAYGLAAAIFFVAYCVCEVPSNLLLAKFGARIWLARIMVSWGIVTILTGFVQDTTQLYIARFLLGIAEAGFFPGMILYITLWFRSRDRAIALGTLVAAQPVAFLVGGVGSGLILDHVHWFGLHSWQWVFLLTGIPAVVIGVLTFRLLPEAPQRVRWLKPDEAASLQDSLDAEMGKPEKHSVRAQLASLKSRRVLHLALINCVTALGFYGFNLFVPLILKQINPTYSATNIGLLAILPYGCATLGLIVYSMVAKHVTRVRLLNIVLTLVSATGISGIIVFRGNPEVALAFLTLMAISCFIFVPAFWSLASAALPRSQAVVGFGVVNSFSAIGGFLGPYIVGQAAVGTNVTGGLLAPLISLLLGTVLLVLWKGRPAVAVVPQDVAVHPSGETV